MNKLYPKISTQAGSKEKLHVDGELRVPGDKSISHRALMLAAAARGESHLRGLLTGADCQSTASVLRSLGVAVPDITTSGEVVLRSPGLAGWASPTAPLDCGNSGTTARLMLGLLAGLPLEAVVTGDASLRARPIRRVTVPLTEMGAAFQELERPDRLPVRLRGGQLRSIAHRSQQASAQVKSAVILAGLTGRVPVSVTEPSRSRDHTERLLSSFGVRLEEGMTPSGWRVAMEPIDEIPSVDFDIPGDFSSAAYPLALAILADSGELVLRDVGLNPTRSGLLDVLRRMGADLAVEVTSTQGGEPVGTITVRPGPLVGTRVEAHEIPAMIDEIPVLAVLAARAEGETSIQGAAELRVKESDRLAAIAANFVALGVDVEELHDGLSIVGTDRPLRGRIRSFGDHRIAMAFAVLGRQPDNLVEIDEPAVVTVSYPDFWWMLDKVAVGW